MIIILGDDTVTVEIGEPDRVFGPSVFKVHPQLLCKSLPYFDKAFNGSFKEAREKRIELTHESPVGFGYIMRWLYTGSVDCNPPNSSATLFTLCRLWVAADRYCAPWLQNQIADTIIDAESTPPLDDVRYVYNSTTSDMPLRTLIVDLAAWRRTGKFFDKINELPTAAIGDLCGAWKSRFLGFGKGEAEAPWKTDRTRYHVKF